MEPDEELRAALTAALERHRGKKMTPELAQTIRADVAAAIPPGSMRMPTGIMKSTLFGEMELWCRGWTCEVSVEGSRLDVDPIPIDAEWRPV